MGGGREEERLLPKTLLTRKKCRKKVKFQQLEIIYNFLNHIYLTGSTNSMMGTRVLYLVLLRVFQGCHRSPIWVLVSTYSIKRELILAKYC